MDAVTSYETMLPIFLMDLPGVNNYLAKQALYMAGRKFCLDTELYSKELDPVDIVADTQSYSLSALLPDNTKIISFGDVRYGSSATTETTAPYLTDNYNLYEETYFKFVTAPTTSITDGLVCNVMLRPTVGSTGLESWFFDRYYEAINAYGKFYLLRMDSKKPWTDPNRAKDYESEYRDYLNRYRREKLTQYKNGLIHVEHVPERF